MANIADLQEKVKDIFNNFTPHPKLHTDYLANQILAMWKALTFEPVALSLYYQQ